MPGQHFPTHKDQRGGGAGPDATLISVLSAWGLIIISLILLGAGGRFIPLLEQNLYLAAAILFMVVPFLFRGRGTSPSPHPGPIFKPIWKNLGGSILVMAITFPVYSVGFHLYQVHYLKQEARFSADQYRKWPQEWNRVQEKGTPERGDRGDDAPATGSKEAGVTSRRALASSGPLTGYMDGNRLHLQWDLSRPESTDTPGDRQSLDPAAPLLLLSGDGVFHVQSPGRHLRRATPKEQESLALPPGAPALTLHLQPDPRTGRYPLKGNEVIRLEGGDALTISQLQFGSAVEGTSLVLGSIRTGAKKEKGAGVAGPGPPGGRTVQGKRSTHWILWMVLFHLLLVAVPEEYFFREFIQARLNTVFTGRITVGRLSVPWVSILVTSVLFALGHYLVDLSPARLSVFFPSLLFGVLRSSTGSIGGAAIYHAMCNVLVELLSTGYGPV